MEANLKRHEEIKYEIKGKLSGKKFSKIYQGTSIADFQMWNDKIILFSLNGFLLYNPFTDQDEWIYKNEHTLIRHPLVEIDDDSGNIYAFCSLYPEMNKILAPHTNLCIFSGSGSFPRQ
ncbi:hypothetical protein SMSP2_01675 [Limihaloglobus sulfuriphilus]|uniref:Uncharacterized protein n=1 Tax=Limihaloglobus sulfuriphilus TaxID=1851148 RepID=A0A1Q2MF75_9BACT|nr:hypothetical protein SMSP2_01675 [Limihaloglobus sulfuriphilus]